MNGPTESKCPHCGGHLGWVYTIPPGGLVVTTGAPIPLGVTAAHVPMTAPPPPAPRPPSLSRATHACGRCAEGWICEAHPERPWPHDDCAGPGMPCPNWTLA